MKELLCILISQQNFVKRHPFQTATVVIFSMWYFCVNLCNLYHVFSISRLRLWTRDMIRLWRGVGAKGTEIENSENGGPRFRLQRLLWATSGSGPRQPMGAAQCRSCGRYGHYTHFIVLSLLAFSKLTFSKTQEGVPSYQILVGQDK